MVVAESHRVVGAVSLASECRRVHLLVLIFTIVHDRYVVIFLLIVYRVAVVPTTIGNALPELLLQERMASSVWPLLLVLDVSIYCYFEVR